MTWCFPDAQKLKIPARFFAPIAIFFRGGHVPLPHPQIKVKTARIWAPNRQPPIPNAQVAKHFSARNKRQLLSTKG
jgi:hypothetical protein